jgi:hypothetical protein
MLTYDETGTLAPGALATPAPLIGVFAIGGGLNLSSEAVRTETLNAYALVSDLNKKRCSPEDRPNGPFLLQSDLKLFEWLSDVAGANMMKTISIPESEAAASNNNVVQHEVNFIITTGGTLNPSWKISTVIVNPSANLLSLDRIRTNDLIITLGPPVQAVVTLENGHKVVTSEPSSQAANLHLTSTVGNAINNAITSGLNANGFIIH